MLADHWNAITLLKNCYSVLSASRVGWHSTVLHCQHSCVYTFAESALRWPWPSPRQLLPVGALCFVISLPTASCMLLTSVEDENEKVPGRVASPGGWQFASELKFFTFYRNSGCHLKTVLWKSWLESNSELCRTLSSGTLSSLWHPLEGWWEATAGRRSFWAAVRSITLSYHNLCFDALALIQSKSNLK